MIEYVAQQPIKRSHLAFLVAFCLLLPNIHITALASQVVIPREFFLYFCSALFVLFLSKRDKLSYNVFFLVALVFLAWQGLALAWSSDLSTGVEEVLNAYVFLLSAFVLYQIRDKRIRILLLNTLIFSVSLAALIGILQNFNWNPLDIHQATKPSSTFNNKNLAASASLMFFPIILAQLLAGNRRHHQLLFSLAATCTLSFILITHTKGVLLAGLCLLLLALLTYMVIRPEERQAMQQRFIAQRFYLAGVVLLSLAIVAMPGAPSAESTKLDDYSLTSHSAAKRFGFYLDAVPLIAEHPIVGIGSGSLRREIRAEPGGDYERQHAEGHKYLLRLHNDHLQYLVEQGLVGLTLWLALLFVLIKTSIRRVRETHDSFNNRLLIYSLLLGILGMLLHAMLSFPIRSVSTGSLFWCLIGLLLSYQNDRRKINTHAIPPMAKHPIVAALLMTSVFAIDNVTHRAIGSYYTKQAADILSPNYCFAAKYYLNNLLETTSLDIRSAQLLAVTYNYCGGESPERTIALMDRILAFEPNHSLALYVKAGTLSQLGDSEAAYRLYRHVLQINKHDMPTYLAMAKIDLANDRRAQAIAVLKQGRKVNPKNKKLRELLDALEKR